METLEYYLSQLTDKRAEKGNKQYPLSKFIMAVLLGILSGAKGYRDLKRFMKNNLDDLKKYIHWQGDKVPSHETIRKIISNIDFAELNQAFLLWQGYYFKPEKGKWFAADGKAIRSCVTNAFGKEQEFAGVISIFSHQFGISIEQQGFSSKKEGEGKALRDIIQRLQYKGLVLTMDALHAQKNNLPAN